MHTKDGMAFLQVESQTAVLGDGGRSTMKARTAIPLLALLLVGCDHGHDIDTEPDSLPMTARVLDNDSYRALKQPFDKLLPDSVPVDAVEAELAVMKDRFRNAMSKLGTEGEDWALPGHYQHVHVFYVYLHTRSMYSPQLVEIIRDTMQDYDASWIAQFECYNVPGCADRRITLPLYHNGQFVFSKDHIIDDLIPALGLEREDVEP